MRNVSVVFRILLLPIFLVRFCFPRPPETAPKQLNNFGDGLHSGDSHFQKHVNEKHFTELVQNESEETPLLNTDPAEFEKLRQNVRLLKLKRENFAEGHSFREVHKTALNTYSRDMEKLNRGKQLQLFGTNSNLNGNQGIEAPLHEHKQTVPLTQLHFKEGLSKDATKNNNEKASTFKVERLSDLQIPSSGHSAVTYRKRDSSRFRAKRSVHETFEAPRLEQAPSGTTPPEYMVHLFQLLSGTQYETLRNFVVTGFVNIKPDTDSSMTPANVTTRGHNLIFDVNIPYETETIHYAELRLYFVHLGHDTADKCGSETTDHHEQTYQIRIFDKNELVDSKPLAEKTVTNVQNSWVSFNLTATVQRWMTPGLRAIEIATTFCGNCTNADSGSNESCQDCPGNCSNDLVVNLDHDQGMGPILVMFSRKSETHMDVPHRREVRDTLKQKGHLQLLEEDPELSNKDNDYNKDASSGHLYFQGLVEFISATSTDSSHNAQSSNFASLKDFVRLAKTVNPQNDTDKDNNQTQNKTNNSTFLNLKDNEPLTINISSTYKPPQRQSPGTNTEDGSTQKHLTFLKEHRWKTVSPGDDGSKLSDDTLRMRLRRDAKVRYRRHVNGLFKRETDNPVSRHKRSKKKRVSCQRNEMYVDFETIKWDKVIIFPRGYQAFECVGKCYTPINEYLTPTKHAIIQTLVHTSYPDQASRACCVPTKLDPISILYWDDNGDIKYDYTYEGMVVAECGCR